MNREKKSETLEVRLPYSTKKAFMKACAQNSSTASDAVRQFIDAYIARSGRISLQQLIKEMTMKLSRNPKKVTGILAAATAGAIVFGTLPSAADPAAFDKLDANGDGVLTEGEIAPGQDSRIIAVLDEDGSGDVSRDEFDSKSTVVKVRKNMELDNDVQVSIIEGTRSEIKIDGDNGRIDILTAGDAELVEGDGPVRVILNRRIVLDDKDAKDE